MMKRATVVAVLLALAACGSDSNSTTNNNQNTSPVATKTYQATVNGGTLTLFFGPATALVATPRSEFASTTLTVGGTFTPSSGTPVTISGTFDTATGAFTVSGGGYSVTGTFANGTISGTFTPPSGTPLSFSATEVTNDPCNAFVNAINNKAASCSLQANPLFLNACKSAEFSAACTAADRTALNTVVSCVSSVPACSSQSSFEANLQPCVENGGGGLSTACNSALGAQASQYLSLVAGTSSGGGTTTGAGSCTIANSTATACVEFGGSLYAAAGASAIQQACSGSCSGSGQTCTYSANACSTSGRVGRCVINYSSGGLTWSTTASYYTGDATSLAQACNAFNGVTGVSSAVWTAG